MAVLPRINTITSIYTGTKWEKSAFPSNYLLKILNLWRPSTWLLLPIKYNYIEFRIDRCYLNNTDLPKLQFIKCDTYIKAKYMRENLRENFSYDIKWVDAQIVRFCQATRLPIIISVPHSVLNLELYHCACHPEAYFSSGLTRLLCLLVLGSPAHLPFKTGTR